MAEPQHKDNYGNVLKVGQRVVYGYERGALWGVVTKINAKSVRVAVQAPVHKGRWALPGRYDYKKKEHNAVATVQLTQKLVVVDNTIEGLGEQS